MTTNNEEVDVCDVLLERLRKEMNTAEAIYSLTYEDVISVIAEVYDEKALKWDTAKLLRKTQEVKGWMIDAADWFNASCTAIEDNCDDI